MKKRNENPKEKTIHKINKMDTRIKRDSTNTEINENNNANEALRCSGGREWRYGAGVGGLCSMFIIFLLRCGIWAHHVEKF